VSKQEQIYSINFQTLMKHFNYTSFLLSLILFFGLVAPFGQVTNATQVEPQAATQVEPQAAPQAEPQAATQVEPQTATQVEPQAATQAEPQATTQVATQVEPQAATQVEPKSTVQVEIQTVTQVEIRTATQVEPQAVTQVETKAVPSRNKGLARLTVYWATGTGTDYWSSHNISASGATLKAGVCAVDPKRIQYGSTVTIPGVGTFTAVDTGTDVRSRKAARLLGKTVEEQSAQVIDIFFETKADALAFARTAPHFAHIEWSGKEAATPQSM
jgi:3D (Asp-Asp-Asp) domain-containing protein